MSIFSNSKTPITPKSSVTNTKQMRSFLEAFAESHNLVCTDSDLHQVIKDSVNCHHTLTEGIQWNKAIDMACESLKAIHEERGE